MHATVMIFSPSSQRRNYTARLGEEAESFDGSSADEEAPAKHSRWRGKGSPMQVGVGCTTREVCDGQGLASPGRWAPADRRYPTGGILQAGNGICCSLAIGLCTETRKAGASLSLGTKPGLVVTFRSCRNQGPEQPVRCVPRRARSSPSSRRQRQTGCPCGISGSCSFY